MAAASLVLGLAGFGNGLVAIAFLPYFMPSATAIAVLTIYTIGRRDAGATGGALFDHAGLEPADHQGQSPGVLLREPGRDPGRLLVGEGLDG